VVADREDRGTELHTGSTPDTAFPVDGPFRHVACGPPAAGPPGGSELPAAACAPCSHGGGRRASGHDGTVGGGCKPGLIDPASRRHAAQRLLAGGKEGAADVETDQLSEPRGALVSRQPCGCFAMPRRIPSPPVSGQEKGPAGCPRPGESERRGAG
jgi:hypothetical protein